MIQFEIGGKKIRPNKIGDALMQAVLENLSRQIKERIGSIRDPETGEFPTVVMRGNSLDDLHMHVEGSPELIELVRRRMEYDEERAGFMGEKISGKPRAFLSFTWDDRELAEHIATALQANGIETWWAEWCISAGDSLRQKIDEGLENCTHFLVLLTPKSITKPWVNQEMDAGLVRKLNRACKFIPVRYKLPASDLPPLLSGMLAPEIKANQDITQLINDIHGIGRKPRLGKAPHAASSETKTGYSAAANAVARYFVQNSKHGRFGDPMTDVEPLAQEAGLSLDDTKDALYELSAFFKDNPFHVVVKPSLFAEFDRHWKDWDPREDALKLAADIMNDEAFPADSESIAERYGWEARRLNAAATFLNERDLITDYQVMGQPQFEHFRIVGKADKMRRFLKSRQ